MPLKGRYGVDITPLSYLPGGRIERYLGNLNFFFIRESTSIREVRFILSSQRMEIKQSEMKEKLINRRFFLFVSIRYRTVA